MITRRPILHTYSLLLIDVMQKSDMILAAQRNVWCESCWAQSTTPESAS